MREYFGQFRFEEPHGLDVGVDLGVGGAGAERVADGSRRASHVGRVGRQYGRRRIGSHQRRTWQTQTTLVHLFR